jgi:hypothetical protein
MSVGHGHCLGHGLTVAHGALFGRFFWHGRFRRCRRATGCYEQKSAEGCYKPLSQLHKKTPCQFIFDCFSAVVDHRAGPSIAGGAYQKVAKLLQNSYGSPVILKESPVNNTREILSE